MNRYDVIVVGCNVSSLISAILLLNDGYKVLLVDKEIDKSETIKMAIVLLSEKRTAESK